MKPELPVPCATRFRWTSGACSHVGRVREINEDACLDQPERGLWVVADGMGGHTLGDFASRMVVAGLDQLEPPAGIGEFIAAARQRLQAVNRQLRAEAANRRVPVIGSTVVLLLACNGYGGYLWAGDSRLYLYRNGRLKQLTRDHNQIEELKSRGELSPDDTIDYPARNAITRAVGAVDRLELDEKTLPIQDRDMFLLCSDGLSNEVGEPEIARVLLVAGSCGQAAETLVELALDHGGRDNISAVVVRAEDMDSTDNTAVNPAV